MVTQATIHHTFAPELQPGPWFPSGVDPTTFPAHQDRVPIPDRELWDSNRLEETPCSPCPPFPFGTDTSLLWRLSWEQEDGYSGPGLYPQDARIVSRHCQMSPRDPNQPQWRTPGLDLV